MAEDTKWNKIGLSPKLKIKENPAIKLSNPLLIWTKNQRKSHQKIYMSFLILTIKKL